MKDYRVGTSHSSYVEASVSQILYDLKKQKQKRERSKNTKVGVKRRLNINQVVSNAVSRRAKRSKTNTIPLAANLIPNYEGVASSGTVCDILYNTTTRFRILGGMLDVQETEWLPIEVARNSTINESLTVVETTCNKYEKIVLQGKCSATARSINCHVRSFILLYGNVFWCLHWKLTKQW